MEEIVDLEKFYKKIQESLSNRYKEKIESIFLRMLEIRSAVDRFRLLKEASISKFQFTGESVRNLMENGFIRVTDEENKYTLTAKGILEYEKKNGILIEEKIWNFIDKKYFDLFSESKKELNEKEKLIVFVMIAARAFSKKSSIDLKKGDIALSKWEEIILSSYNFLKDLKIIDKLNENNIFGSEKNFHKVYTFFKNGGKDVPKKTKGFYKTSGDQMYCLDISNNAGKIEMDALRLLFNKIFGHRKLSTDEIDKLFNYFNEIASTKNIYIFDVKEHIFHNPEYDNIIKDALLTA